MRALFSAIKKAAPGIAREAVREAAEDQFKENVLGFKGNLYTDLPTRGGVAYTFLKAAFGSTPAAEKKFLVGELQSEGISAQGAAKLASGENPTSQSDLANLMRLVVPNGADAISFPSVSPEGLEAPAGEVYTAAMVSIPSPEVTISSPRAEEE
jgi:hypothetical protein